MAAALHVECCLQPRCTENFDDVRQYLERKLLDGGSLMPNSLLAITDDYLQENVEHIFVRTREDITTPVSPSELPLCVHVYQLSDEAPFADADGGHGGDATALSSQTLLPSRATHGVWDSLILGAGIKDSLLEYITTAMLFSEHSVNANIVGWNRIVLLHGPPGTGKTSLCRALAHQLSIMHQPSVYTSHYLVEINSHSLFSKWFSESGKLVQRMFSRLTEMLDDPSAFVFVLIDEVESLTAARKSAISGSEPSDAVRVVNAMLTQLDIIKQRKNVLIMATSNLTDAIDDAFIDRADIKQYIGLPGQEAMYQILRSCMLELMRTGLVQPAVPLLEVGMIKFVLQSTNEMSQLSTQLFRVAERAVGLSGRALRKLPFIAHALFVRAATVTPEQFVVALDRAVQHETNARAVMQAPPNKA